VCGTSANGSDGVVDSSADEVLMDNFCTTCGFSLLPSAMSGGGGGGGYAAKNYVQELTATRVEGRLAKKSTFSRHLWQSRFFVLSGATFSYYQSEKERRDPNAAPSKVLQCSEIQRVEVRYQSRTTNNKPRTTTHPATLRGLRA